MAKKYQGYGASVDMILKEFVLSLKHTFADSVTYVGTTTRPDADLRRLQDVDIIVVFSNLTDRHIYYAWRIINNIHIRFNILLDARLYSAEQVDDPAFLPHVNRYLLKLFLNDYLGENPFKSHAVSTIDLYKRALERIGEQEQKIVTIMPRAANDHSQLRAIAQCVFDAIRAFLILENHPAASKEDASARFLEFYPEYSEVTDLYEGYLNPSSIIDVGRFILDSLAIVKHLAYKANKKPIAKEVLLINTPSSEMAHPRDDYLSYDHNMPLGLVCVASYLEKEGVRVRILDSYAENLGAATTVESIFKSSELPQIIGINASSPNIHIVHRIAYYLKRIRKDIHIVCGGAHASLAPMHTLSTGDIDFVVSGEGELPFLAIVRQIQERGEVTEDIPGVFRLVSERLVGTKNTDQVDLRALPTPNFSDLPMARYFAIKRRLYIHTSRGCAYRCIYCSVPECWDGKVREIPMDIVIAQVRELQEKYSPEQFQIVDDNFSHRHGKIIREFCDRLIAGQMTIKWKCQVRADQMPEDLPGIMAQAGCFEADLGIETGNYEIQKKIKKRLDLEKTRQVVSNISRNKIFVKAFFMLGFPEETYEQICDTINYSIELKALGLNDVAFFPVMPFPGTEISKLTGLQVFQGAVIDSIDIRERTFAAHRLRKYSAKPEVSLNSRFSPEELRLLVKFAYQRFNTSARVEDFVDEFNMFAKIEEINQYAS